jgi:hypothetical protein
MSSAQDCGRNACECLDIFINLVLIPFLALLDLVLYKICIAASDSR